MIHIIIVVQSINPFYLHPKALPKASFFLQDINYANLFIIFLSIILTKLNINRKVSYANYYLKSYNHSIMVLYIINLVITKIKSFNHL